MRSGKRGVQADRIQGIKWVVSVPDWQLLPAPSRNKSENCAEVFTEHQAPPPVSAGAGRHGGSTAKLYQVFDGPVALALHPEHPFLLLGNLLLPIGPGILKPGVDVFHDFSGPVLKEIGDIIIVPPVAPTALDVVLNVP